ncbi:hypothetical protein Rhe02_49790 [Rhizocola hellebori]|uniref:Uncharacterized protein n=1 Tax=Rhizocola hellebori TaxID=1392758 RepID=A0A8J3VI34_9ACTN|nr:hypothetical protein Rhe02_49790 [Rhizocola hellebori]
MAYQSARLTAVVMPDRVAVPGTELSCVLNRPASNAAPVIVVMSAIAPMTIDVLVCGGRSPGTRARLARGGPWGEIGLGFT